MVEEKNFEGFESLAISNGEAELVVTTGVGPRLLSYRLRGGENILGLWPKLAQQNDLGTWKPYGGHRLWAAPEEMPRTYYPDNDPVEYEIIGDHAVIVRAPIERITNIQKEIRITLNEGSNVAIQHLITNCGIEPVELAPWALTILRPGGTVVIPQEPFRSHDDDLLPARPMVLWYFTDLSDPRFKLGKQLLELRCDSHYESPQKIGMLNKQGWAAYYSSPLLFVKEFDYRAGAASSAMRYPDYGCNCETYTAGEFIELESLGPMETLQPGESATHRERWRLFDDVKLSEKEKIRAEEIARQIA
ncbi:MAG: hypothetical protein ACHQNE_05670 [Candidatus Kapaibacterium sp.]